MNKWNPDEMVDIIFNEGEPDERTEHVLRGEMCEKFYRGHSWTIDWDNQEERLGLPYVCRYCGISGTMRAKHA